MGRLRACQVVFFAAAALRRRQRPWRYDSSRHQRHQHQTQPLLMQIVPYSIPSRTLSLNVHFDWLGNRSVRLTEALRTGACHRRRAWGKKMDGGPIFSGLSVADTLFCKPPSPNSPTHHEQFTHENSHLHISGTSISMQCGNMQHAYLLYLPVI